MNDMKKAGEGQKELPLTILIVEDHAAVRRLLRRELEALAAEVVECENGAEAASTYARVQPDVVLMDIQMPGMNGLVATKRIKKADAGARVIIVTDYDQIEFRTAAAEAGACGYVTKTDLSQLKGLIQEVVR